MVGDVIMWLIWYTQLLTLSGGREAFCQGLLRRLSAVPYMFP